MNRICSTTVKSLSTNFLVKTIFYHVHGSYFKLIEAISMKDEGCSRQDYFKYRKPFDKLFS